MLSLTHLMNR